MKIIERNTEVVDVTEDMIIRATEGDFEEEGYIYSYDRESGTVARSKAGDVKWLGEVEWLADIAE